jgi:hypothetical protein
MPKRKSSADDGKSKKPVAKKTKAASSEEDEGPSGKQKKNYPKLVDSSTNKETV